MQNDEFVQITLFAKLISPIRKTKTYCILQVGWEKPSQPIFLPLIMSIRMQTPLFGDMLMTDSILPESVLFSLSGICK